MGIARAHSQHEPHHVKVLFSALLLVVVCGSSPAAADAPSPYNLAEFSLATLKDPKPRDLQLLEDAITQVGLFAVTDFQQQKSAGGDNSSAALVHYARCVGASGQDLAQSGDALHSHLQDGTRKTTVATATNGTLTHQLPARVQESCPDFSRASTPLRSSVDLTGRVYARLLDRIVHGAKANGPVPRGAGDSYVGAVMKAESLEHFHVFQNDAAPSEQDGRAPAIDLHSDMGLFIVMTAAEYIHMASGEPVEQHNSRDAAEDDGAGALMPGFYLELASGELVRPVIPPGSLLVMNGEGLERWTRKAPGSVRPHVPGHEVVLPAMEGMGRAWFGRMFLPPRDAVLQQQPGEEDLPVGMTFGEYRDQTVAAIKDGKESVSAVGCAPTRRGLAEVTECTGDQIYCWMSCVDVPADLEASCGRDNIQCENLQTGQLWPQDYRDPATGAPTHCFECGLACDDTPSPPPPPPPSDIHIPASAHSGGSGTGVDGSEAAEGPGFCNTNLPATTMWMMGFQVASKANGCVAYLFESWVLDSGTKFAAACIGSVMAGIVVEWLVCIRRNLQRDWIQGAHGPCGLPPVAQVPVMLSLYLIQVTLGYMAMLVAMIYQVELFLAVVIGLTAGHGIFNLRARVTESADACCQGLDPGSESDEPRIKSKDDIMNEIAGPFTSKEILMAPGGAASHHHVVNVASAKVLGPTSSCCHSQPQ